MTRSALRATWSLTLLMIVMFAAACGDEDSASLDAAESPTEQEVDPTPSAADSTVTVTSATYTKTFSVSSCDNTGELDLTLAGDINGLLIEIEATASTGALSVSGGDEQDGITLNGEIEPVENGDAGDFFVSGTFTEPNFVGEEFTATGICASTLSVTPIEADEETPNAITGIGDDLVDGGAVFNDDVSCVLGPDDSGLIEGTAADGTAITATLDGTASRVVIEGPSGSYDAAFSSVSNDPAVLTIEAGPPPLTVLVVLSFCTES